MHVYAYGRSRREYYPYPERRFGFERLESMHESTLTHTHGGAREFILESVALHQIRANERTNDREIHKKRISKFIHSLFSAQRKYFN